MRRVGLNLLYLLPGKVGGTEIYARRLIHALAAERPDLEWVVFCCSDAAASLREEGWPERVRVHALPVPAANKPARIAAELTLLPGAAARARVDLLHSLGTTTPIISTCPRVVTIHDLIYHHFPATFPRSARAGLELLVPLGARRAHRVLADSEATRGDVIATLRVEPERVDVVHLGLGMAVAPEPTPEAELRDRFALGGDPVVLCVSAALEHKNLPRLLRAFARLEDSSARLVLVGHPGREAEPLRALAAEHGLGERFTITGWISDADLEGLYAFARCFAYPSLFEGFGLPVLEAMRRRVPVACADATSLPEVAGDAAELFDGLDETAIAGALTRVLGDETRRAELIARGVERAERFTWAASARATLAGYERALSSASTARQ